MTREDKVNEFQKAAGRLTYEDDPSIIDMIVDCYDEETVELFEAIDDYDIAPSEATRAQLCKEWADCQYTLSQIAVYFNIPADASFNRVHNSNMTKTIDGKLVFREDGKVLKPDTYEPPVMTGL